MIEDDLASEPIALKAYLRPTGGELVTVMNNGKCVGAASYRVDEKGVKIINIGVTQKRLGFGSQLVWKIMVATKRDDLWCRAVEQAVPFYEKLGMWAAGPLPDGRTLMITRMVQRA